MRRDVHLRVITQKVFLVVMSMGIKTQNETVNETLSKLEHNLSSFETFIEENTTHSGNEELVDRMKGIMTKIDVINTEIEVLLECSKTGNYALSEQEQEYASLMTMVLPMLLFHHFYLKV